MNHKAIFLRLATVLLLSASALAGKDGVIIIHGEIGDTQCALNVHSLTRSHQEMIKARATGANATSCALYCVQHLGGDFVLSSKKEIYRIDDQAEAEKFAGVKVKVTGTLDVKTNVIHVIKIEADE